MSVTLFPTMVITFSFEGQLEKVIANVKKHSWPNDKAGRVVGINEVNSTFDFEHESVFEVFCQLYKDPIDEKRLIAKVSFHAPGVLRFLLGIHGLTVLFGFILWTPKWSNMFSNLWGVLLIVFFITFHIYYPRQYKKHKQHALNQINHLLGVENETKP